MQTAAIGVCCLCRKPYEVIANRHVTNGGAAHTILCMSELFSFIHLPAIGFAIGIIVGLTGVGGGSLMTPILVGGLGIPPAIAVGTDLLFASITKSFGAAAHWRMGNVAKRLLGILIVSSLTGAALAFALIHELQPNVEALNKVIKTALGVALLLGRGFTARDDGNAPKVAIVNETAARFIEFNGVAPESWNQELRGSVSEVRDKVYGMNNLMMTINQRLQELDDAQRRYRSWCRRSSVRRWSPSTRCRCRNFTRSMASSPSSPSPSSTATASN